MKSGRRGNYSREFKAMVAAQACDPGVSVSRLAREHDLNANMVFRWRRDYRAGALAAPVTADPVLMPVNLVAESDAPLVELPSQASRFGGTPVVKPAESSIEIRIGGAVIAVQGDVDVIRLRAVLSALRG